MPDKKYSLLWPYFDNWMPKRMQLDTTEWTKERRKTEIAYINLSSTQRFLLFRYSMDTWFIENPQDISDEHGAILLLREMTAQENADFIRHLKESSTRTKSNTRAFHILEEELQAVIDALTTNGYSICRGHHTWYHTDLPDYPTRAYTLNDGQTLYIYGTYLSLLPIHEFRKAHPVPELQ